MKIAWIRNVLTRVSAYGFVFFLLFMEWVLRKLASVDAREFMGPTLAAAGVGFVVPLAPPKSRLSVFSAPTQDDLKKSSMIAVSEGEQLVYEVTRAFLLVLIAAWVYDVYLVCIKANGFLGLSPLALGVITYFVSVIIAEAREAF